MCGSIYGPSSWGWVHFGRKSLITLTVHLACWVYLLKSSWIRGLGIAFKSSAVLFLRKKRYIGKRKI